MDQAVALVETYLRVNGYLTVTEYPVLEAEQYGGYRAVTDLDVLAFRFPGAGRLVLNSRSKGAPNTGVFEPDPELGCKVGSSDMLIGEVKEGKPKLNPSAKDPAVLSAVLTRFGCCQPSHAPEIVKMLLRRGEADTHCGHRVRYVVFGTQDVSPQGSNYRVISLGHVQHFLQTYIRDHWDVLRHAQFKDPVFGFLALLEKSRFAPGKKKSGD